MSIVIDPSKRAKAGLPLGRGNADPDTALIIHGFSPRAGFNGPAWCSAATQTSWAMTVVGLKMSGRRMREIRTGAPRNLSPRRATR